MLGMLSVSSSSLDRQHLEAWFECLFRERMQDALVTIHYMPSVACRMVIILSSDVYAGLVKTVFIDSV